MDYSDYIKLTEGYNTCRMCDNEVSEGEEFCSATCFEAHML